MRIIRELIGLIIGTIGGLLTFIGIFLGIGMAFAGDFKFLIAGIIGFVMMIIGNRIIGDNKTPRYATATDTNVEDENEEEERDIGLAIAGFPTGDFGIYLMNKHKKP
ncbi:hypothetical protein JCM14244_17100 [Venenivibrio stagnispumantis]|uniref:Uncharacterized protein n=1 Tax=Venenivibrio stagnispumantis TaxID=407998 RepID=A0AA46AFY8_9AQUI|nr:hypothetical protein [Venenivibrio stagnispumantis]MCW4573969.1 hypothetical protein [Venenivibrio stagnispumantis]SMP22495.1 hypothetical protein SAMN06264868_1265 [Venenivibrio stagnispumantis]